MSLDARRAIALISLLASSALIAACDSSRDRGGAGDMAMAGPSSADLSFADDAFFETDPPLMYCALDGGSFPPPMIPTGTPECPSDKNREGCPCPTQGMQAPCWPGLRANRNLGICMDGTTTCEQQGELSLAWGPCMGYVLPVEGATDGKDACKCFSGGKWALANLSPCFYTMQDGSIAGASSSVMSGGSTQCTAVSGNMLVLPSQPWSTDTITADCEGRFTLCYALKAGDAKNPMASDCTIAKVCVSGDYTQVNMAQNFPPLPAWVTTSPDQVTCAQKFGSSGGYGEMSVQGTTLTCDMLGKTFLRVGYCPLSCSTNPNGAGCANCSANGSGQF